MPGPGTADAALPLPGEEGAALEIRLFGRMEVRVASQPLRQLRSRKGLWLLALMALRGGRDLDRDWLAATLWPEDDIPHGRHSLRQTLYDLRLALGTEASRLAADGLRTLRLELAGAFVDALAFDTALARGDPESLAAAVRLYRAPLLEDCAEEWALEARRWREQGYLGALGALAARATADGQPGVAAGYLRLAVAADPYREELRRELIEALAAGGNPAAALLVYRDYSELLRQEMGAAPAEETTALFRRLREETRLRAQPRARERPTAASGPAPATSSRAPSALPRPLTELVGREEEVREVVDLLGHARLVTLTGTGGVGKTRLAVQVAAELANEFPDGAGFVGLGALSDGTLVAAEVAKTIGIAEPNDHPVVESLCESLRDRELLLVLDNCEHLLDACAELADRLLHLCAGVRILATSRQPLGLMGEADWRVPSLEVPDSPHLPAGVKDALSYFLNHDAVRLFVARARQADRRFRLDPREAAAVAEICRRLDGIPLAIELAAARARAMPVAQIAQRLDDRFRLLTGGSRTALPRQRTLRGAIDWSYDLLSEPERQLLRRLSVFAGGWTLEAAEAVCAGEGKGQKAKGKTGPPEDPDLLPFPLCLLPSEILDLLTSLVDRSLVVYDEVEAGGRYRFLDSMRQYASEQLHDAGEDDALRDRHVEFFLELAEEAEAHLTGTEQSDWLERLETEHDNLRAAIAQALAREEQRRNEDGAARAAPYTDAALRIAAALGRFWVVRGHLTEGRAQLARALASAADTAAVRAKALNVAGNLAFRQADYPAARSLLDESLAICRQLGDRSGTAYSLNSMGGVAFAQNDYESARSLYEESLAIRRGLGDRWGIAGSLNNLGTVAFSQKDYREARSLGEESLALLRELGDRSGTAHALNNLGMVAYAHEDYEAARSLHEESLAMRRALGDRLGIASSLHLLGDVAVKHRDYRSARSLYQEGLAMRHELGDRWGIAGLLEALASLTCEAHGERDDSGGAGTAERFSGQATVDPSSPWRRAARLFGAAEAFRESIGISLHADEEEDHCRDVARARGMLGEEAFAAAWAEGRAMTLERAIADALDDTTDLTYRPR